jgi:uncharacterized membrane protein
VNADYQYWMRRGDRWHFVAGVLLALGIVGFVASVVCPLVLILQSEAFSIAAASSALFGVASQLVFDGAAHACYRRANELMIAEIRGGSH